MAAPVTDAREAPAESSWAAFAPLAFVLLWSTGFVGAVMGLPYAEPFTFLAIRFFLVSLLLLAVIVLFRAPWPKTWGEAAHIAVAGIFLHGVYFGGMYVAMSVGVPGGIAALIAGLQPILTGLGAGPMLGERIGLRQWTGLILGLGGVALVVSEKLTPVPDHMTGIVAAGIGAVGISIGTLYQKKYASHMGLRSGSAIQFMTATLIMGILAVTTETMDVRWTGEFIFSMFWLVFVLSLGAMSLLMFVIRRGVAYKTASLFYLVPPVTAVMTYFAFDETLGPIALLGMGVTVGAVALVVTRTSAKPPAQP